MEEKRLYPMSFCSLVDTYPWGSDEFLLADLGYRDSLVRDGWLAGNTIGEVMDTYMDRVVGENAFAFWGRQFPVQVKKISVNGTMPLRVHPDADTAVRRYDFLGREKLWYVLSAQRGARIFAGWDKDTDATEVYQKCVSGTAAGILRSFEPQAGQYIHIPAGTPHSASGKLEILEVSESSPLDFCLSGLGSEVHPDEFDDTLGLVEALDFINYGAFKGSLMTPGNSVRESLLEIPQFEVKLLRPAGPVKIGSEDAFILYTCIGGSAVLQMEVLGQEAGFKLESGRSMLLPSECERCVLLPEKQGTVLLETIVPPQREADSYTG